MLLENLVTHSSITLISLFGNLYKMSRLDGLNEAIAFPLSLLINLLSTSACLTNQENSSFIRINVGFPTKPNEIQNFLLINIF